MNNRISSFLEHNSIDISGKKVLLGFSGGPDSTLLLHYLLHVREKLRTELRIMHLNHMERDDADNEEQTVMDICRNHSIECSLYREDVYSSEACARFGFERAARELRLHYLNKDADECSCDYIMTGHNLTDRVETMLINLERGTGLRGLISMRPVSGKFVKPLLFLTKNEIISFLRDNNIAYIEDETNNDQSLGRNRIRHNIIPVLESHMKNGLYSIERSINMLDETETVLREQMNRLISNIAQYGSDIVIDIDKLSQHECKTQRALLYYIMQEHYMVNSAMIEQLEKMIQSEKPNLDKVFGSFRAVRAYNKLIITKSRKHDCNDSRVELSDSALYNGYRMKRMLDKCPLPFDDSKFVCLPHNTGSLYIRTYRHGDRFRPFGMRGSMKLKDFFINSKIPAYKRRRIPLLTDSDDNILWITGYRRSDHYNVNTNKECTVVYGQKD